MKRRTLLVDAAAVVWVFGLGTAAVIAAGALAFPALGLAVWIAFRRPRPLRLAVVTLAVGAVAAAAIQLLGFAALPGLVKDLEPMSAAHWRAAGMLFAFLVATGLGAWSLAPALRRVAEIRI
jgi:hypothetical protein